MKKHLLFNLLIILSFLSCNNENDSTKAEEFSELEEMYSDILILSESIVCEDASEWHFSPIGSKACGGPQGYVAYSDEIDVESFLAQVAAYTEAENEFNIKWNVFSDCSLAQHPTAITCENGVAILVY